MKENFKTKEYFMERKIKKHTFLIDFLSENDKKIVNDAIEKISNIKGKFIEDEMTTFVCDLITEKHVYSDVKIDFDDEKEYSKYMNDIEEIQELIGEKICKIEIRFPKCNEYDYHKIF